MIITSTKKKKPNIIDNIQKLLDTAGETQFKNIYKNLQVEIKDKIITKLLSKLEIQNKQIENYKQEIISLKNDLVYLLKRVIISKNEEKINASNAKTKKNFNKLNKANNYDISSFSPLNNTSSQIKSFNNFNNHLENNNNNKLSFDITNIYPINSNQSEVDIKINNYINSIYKHNFLKNETNINDYYSLNKKENLYEEIFLKKSNNKKIEGYTKTDPCINRKKNLQNNRSQRNISTCIPKRAIESLEEKKKSNKLSSSMINIKNKYEYMTDIKNNEEFEDNKDNNEDEHFHKKRKINIIVKNSNYGNNYLKVKKKTDDLDLPKKQLNSYKSFKNKTQHNGFYSVTGENKISHNTNTAIKKKIKRNYHYIPVNRSPFLANKF